MNKLWYEKKWGKDKICGITLTRLRPGKNSYGLSYVTKLDCEHSFYTKPLIEWSKLNHTCPLCRKEFDPLTNIFQSIIH